MKGIIAGIGTILVGFWIYPYLKTSVLDWLSDFLTTQFPTMNTFLLLFLTWLPLIVIGLIVYAAISLVLNLATGGRR